MIGTRSAQLALLLAAVTLGGCNAGEVLRAPDEYARGLIKTGKWRNAERSPPNTVEIVTLEHAVDFQVSQESLTPFERSRLTDFLRQTGVQTGDRITLHGPLRDFGRHDPVTAKRLESLQAELETLGVESEIADNGRIQPRDRERIALLITRAVAITPDCAQSPPPSGRRPSWVMGCSNTAVLGHMVADPLDLVEGREMGPADGEFGALRIQRYREGDIEQLEEVQIDTTDE